MNEQTVLETVFRERAVSRAAIARITDLSKPTVSSIIGDLEACGLVRQRGQSSGTVGRPSALYEVNAQAGYVFAVDLGGTKIRAGIGDIYGDVIAADVDSTKTGSGEALVAQVEVLFRKLLDKAGVANSDVRAAGIGIPGIYDPSADRVSSTPNVPGLHDFPILERLTDALGVRIVIDNDVNLAAAGESWRGLATGLETFVAISIGTGIGMGIVIGGEIYRGVRGAAGEIDFLPIGADPVNDADGHGPFESVAAGPAIVAEFEKRMAGGATSSADPSEGVAGIFSAAGAGDPEATEVLQLEARRVAQAIVAVCTVLDPALVVLGGGVGSNPHLLEPVRSHVAKMSPRPPTIETSALGNQAAFMGAMAVGLGVARQQLLTDVSETR